MRRILIVDEYPAVARAVARSLRSHNTTCARDMAEALQRIESEEFDAGYCGGALRTAGWRRAAKDRSTAMAARALRPCVRFSLRADH